MLNLNQFSVDSLNAESSFLKILKVNTTKDRYHFQNSVWHLKKQVKKAIVSVNIKLERYTRYM